MTRAGCAVAMVFAFMVAFAQTSSAQTPDKTAGAWLVAAQAANADGRYLEAEKAIASGLQIAPKNFELLRLRGEVRLSRRDFVGARDAYKAYLAARPRGANRRKAKKIIANLAAAETTQIEVSIGTGEARVFLDAKSLGVFCVADPTCIRGLLPGRYKVFVERRGFQPANMEVQLRQGKTTPAVFSLVEKPSTANISVAPSDAVIAIDGRKIELGEELLLRAGEHKITATLDGFSQIEKTVIAAKGEPLTLSLVLSEEISVTTNIEGAVISLDGTVIESFAGVVLIPSDGNPHAISARAKDHQPAEVEISANRERGQPIVINLEKGSSNGVTPTSLSNQQRVWTTQRRALFAALLGIGALGAGIGTFTGLSARSDWNATDDECDNLGFCSSLGLELRNDAIGNATASNISFGIAAAALFGAAAVYLTAPTSDSSDGDAGLRASAIITDSEIGLSVRLGF